MTDLSPKERALIALAEGGDDPSEAARDRMRSNLFALSLIHISEPTRPY